MRKILASILSLALVFCAGCFKGEKKASQPVPPPASSEKGKFLDAFVVTVLDGDTILVRVGYEKAKVRLIGIDTPESVHRDESKNTREGKIASQRLKGYLEGKHVKLEFDKEKQDKYNRWLAYVYLGDEMINRELLIAGLARTLTIPPNTKYADEFAELEAGARDGGAGFWGKESDLFLRSK